MSDTFHTTTRGDTRAQALNAAKMQAAIYFADEPFEVSYLSAELRGSRYHLEAYLAAEHRRSQGASASPHRGAPS